MSTTHSSIGEHDVVVLREPVEGWPRGTKGAVVAVFASSLWVEVVDQSGDNFDLILSPAARLDLVRKYSQPEAVEAD